MVCLVFCFLKQRRWLKQSMCPRGRQVLCLCARSAVGITVRTAQGCVMRVCVLAALLLSRMSRGGWPHAAACVWRHTHTRGAATALCIPAACTTQRKQCWKTSARCRAVAVVFVWRSAMWQVWRVLAVPSTCGRCGAIGALRYMFCRVVAIWWHASAGCLSACAGPARWPSHVSARWGWAPVMSHVSRCLP